MTSSKVETSQDTLTRPQKGARLAIYGGGFDPVHNGHLAMARAVLDSVSVDSLSFLPAAHSPLKPNGPRASEADRLSMLELAVAGEPAFRVNDFEIRRGGISYSVDSAAQLQLENPKHELCWVLGADQFVQLDRWRDIDRLAGMVAFLVLARPGFPIEAPPVRGLRFEVVPAPLVELSSTAIRERCRNGQSLGGLVPPTVEAFISKRALYTDVL